ncbi:MAG TPA: putative Ig domain-containing protein, partial [Verrucomicrobiae bacterium]|nr:putative Ig domain-containing protein [Verrucomicrobiae bacterium]
GTDYVFTNGTLTFNPGETNKSISIYVTGNTNGGPGEAFFLMLGNPNNLLIGTTQGVCNIVNGYNTAPTLPAITNRTVHAGYTLAFTVHASDTDMDTMTYSLDPGAPAGANIDPNLGMFSWTPGSGFTGTTNTITVRATDNGLPPLSAASTFSVIVVAPPRISTPSFSSAHIALAWSAISGQTYRVQYKTNLLSAWNNLSGDVTATSALASKTDPGATGGQRFYRILVLP